jgi:hypothetical protein
MTAQTLVIDGGLSAYLPVMSPPLAMDEHVRARSGGGH